MLIEGKNLSHSYKHSVFKNISLDVEIGDFVALYGPSWSGKTTFLKIFWKLLEPHNGDIIFDKILNNRQENFWYSFVDGPFFENLTVKENILFLENFSNIRVDTKKYKEMMKFFEMERHEQNPVKNLSVGQRERVNIMRAFVHHPKLIIIDEPGSNLDERMFEKLFTFLEKEKQSKQCAILIATHDERYKKIANKTLNFKLLEDE